MQVNFFLTTKHDHLMQDQRQLPYSDILYCNTSHVQDYIRIDVEAVGAYVILLGLK